MLKLTFLDQAPYVWYYGNGDCTYIEFPNGKNMLVDISTKHAGSLLVKKLVDMNVGKIDYFVVSHLHKDHTGGFAELADTIPIGQIVISGYGFHSAEADVSFLEAVAKHNISMLHVRKGDKLNIGDVKLHFLFPPKDTPEVASDLPYVEQEKNSNIYSLVFKMIYGDFSIMFAGDVYEEAELQLMQLYREELQSTVYKIPHHGNDTSYPQFAIGAVKPQLAVTMCRCCEWEVQKNFSNAGIPVYGPFFDGTIIMQTDGKQLQVDSVKGIRIWREMKTIANHDHRKLQRGINDKRLKE